MEAQPTDGCLGFFTRLFAAVLVVALTTGYALAQTQPVTMDDVYAVAEKMYCPICENEPLDDCRAATCVQWREEIRQQLQAGRTEDQIISSFVERYGQHVVGIPQDPALRALSLVTPVILSALAAIAGVIVFLRWRQSTPTITADDTLQATHSDTYRQQLERDLG